MVDRPGSAPPAEPPDAAGRPDVFISYARENRPAALQLAQALGAQGLRVWWDRELPAGSEFAEVIEAQLQGARVVLTLWSAESVRSGFVRDESSRALRSGKLLPLRLEEVELPLGFGHVHTLDLFDWDGDTEDEHFQRLLHELRRVQGRPEAVSQPPVTGRRRRLRRVAAMALLAIAVGGVGVGGKLAWDARTAGGQAERARTEADRHFIAGLEHQFAKEPRLENALNEYLSTLELRPSHARARYYLAHVYAQSDKPQDAREAFRLALAQTEAPLDRGQRADAQKQLQALSADPQEAAPVARSQDRARAGADEHAASADRRRERPPPVAAAAPALARPPRMEPPAETLANLAARVDGLFDENKELRISATTGLILDPEALSDAVPLAVVKALGVLRDPARAATPAASSGVVNTLVLLQSATPGTLETQRRPIEELLAAARGLGATTRGHAAKVGALLQDAAQRTPLAYIQIANEAQEPIAQALAARLRSAGYAAPGIERVGDRAPSRNEVRVHGRSERGFERWVVRLVGELAGAPPRVSTLRNVQAPIDTYEIWLARDLCAPGGIAAPGCRAAGP